ncbi:hypothetical protein K1T71_003503 [Dendrolimus kikuchii]|uniref:Uncharacterized protein n=1 Tax=Dendrolimus kikuchii TaxID=765133 RepID=A0ACC1DBW0_9NEOP|nr:hypothetical protein K1T71_003503 [Dendrolimus kikuchii]
MDTNIVSVYNTVLLQTNTFISNQFNMFTFILVSALLVAGGASANANPSGPAQMPNIVPAVAAKAADVQPRAIAIVIGKIFYEYRHLFEKLEFYNLQYEFWFCDCIGVKIVVDRFEVCGLSTLELINIDYVDNVLVVEVSVEKLTVNLDGAILDISVVGYPISICISGSIDFGIEKACITVEFLNYWDAIDVQVVLILSLCQSNLQAFIESLNLDISNIINDLIQILSNIANTTSILNSILSEFCGNILTSLLRGIFGIW